MNKVKLVEISWGSEAPPDKDSRYNHVFGTHPLGKFCIEWKSWKELDSYTCYFNDEYWNDAYSLDEAKDLCQKHINIKVNSCIVGVEMTQETERIKTELLAVEVGMKQEVMVCWSCDEQILISELNDNDGFCPLCDAEIER